MADLPGSEAHPLVDGTGLVKQDTVPIRTFVGEGKEFVGISPIELDPLGTIPTALAAP